MVFITYNGGKNLAGKSINQRLDLAASDYWYYLGNYKFAGSSDYLEVYNYETNGHILVDAFKFVPETITSLPIYLAQTPEVFTHDDDGNLIQDGRWMYTYDGENRLIRMESLTSVLASRRLKLVFAYDYLSRRVKKAVYTWNASANTYYPYTSSDSRFVYDGWNLVAELSSSGSLTRSYTWGPDLSGSLQGAGGIGGLVFVRQSGSSYYPTYDGNGNLTAMIRASDKSVVASYDYSPYGELLASSGSYASTNPFRFSTKYTDPETGLSYFGYRYYNPETGRWLSRDPIEESGGISLYGYVNNNPVSDIDAFGLWKIERKGSYMADAVAEEHSVGPGITYLDDIFHLGLQIRLEPEQFKKWLKLNGAKILTVKGAKTLENLDMKDEICSGQKVKIPNSFLIVVGEVSGIAQRNIFDSASQIEHALTSRNWNVLYQNANLQSVTPDDVLRYTSYDHVWGMAFLGHGVMYTGINFFSTEEGNFVLKNDTFINKGTIGLGHYKYGGFIGYFCFSSHGRWKERVSDGGMEITSPFPLLSPLGAKNFLYKNWDSLIGQMVDDTPLH